MERLNIVHHIQGRRCRLRLQRSDLRPMVAAALGQRLSAMKKEGSIVDFSINEPASSVLLLYDGEEALGQAIQTVRDCLPPLPSLAAQAEPRMARRQPAAPHRKASSAHTGGFLVNTAIPIGLELATGTWWVPVAWSVAAAVWEGDTRRGAKKVSRAVASTLLEQALKGAVKGVVCRFT